MTISQLKKELRLTNKDIAGFFRLSEDSYKNSSAKKRYEQGIIEFYKHVKSTRLVITKCPECATDEDFTDHF